MLCEAAYLIFYREKENFPLSIYIVRRYGCLSGLATRTIVGLAVGGLAVAVLVLGGIIGCVVTSRRRRGRASEAPTSQETFGSDRISNMDPGMDPGLRANGSGAQPRSGAGSAAEGSASLYGGSVHHYEEIRPGGGRREAGLPGETYVYRGGTAPSDDGTYLSPIPAPGAGSGQAGGQGSRNLSSFNSAGSDAGYEIFVRSPADTARASRR